MIYEMQVKVPMGRGNHGTEWSTVARRNTSKAVMMEWAKELESHNYTVMIFTSGDIGQMVYESEGARPDKFKTDDAASTSLDGKKV
jgi:hypothetical protein